MFIDITLLYLNVLYVFMYSLFVTVAPMLFRSPRLISSCMHCGRNSSVYHILWINLNWVELNCLSLWDYVYTRRNVSEFVNVSRFVKILAFEDVYTETILRIWLFTLNGMRYQWYVGTRLLSSNVMFPYWKWLSNLRKHEENLKIQTY